ncbi:MAG: glycoside hydrolase family 9 protein [Bacillota bacterium]
MKRLISMLVTAAVLATLLIPASVANAAGYNYVDAFAKSIMFYEANWCGPDAGENRLKWRGPCHVTDGADVGLDLTGGFHDAGDHVKFGLPEGYAASVLNWTLYLYADTLKEKGQYDYLYNICKHFTDYFIRSHPNKDTFYYQIGDGDTDHAYWGPPELQPTSRPSYAKASPSTPASEMCGEAAAALAIMYLNSKDKDPAYAQKCLDAAKSIYVLGKTYKGKGTGQSYYTSGPYWDELCWAGVWLYNATKDSAYLNEVDGFTKSAFGANGAKNYLNNWTMCWDDIWGAVFIELYRATNNVIYKENIEYNLNYWINNIARTPGGLRYLNNWGVLRYAAAECMLALVYYDMSNNKAYLDFAKSQIDYMLGTNPRNSSYVVGFGNNYPKFPHHRAASGRLEGPPADEKKTMPERHILYGALVGGPKSDDSYVDDIDQYVYTEVAIDYNAGFLGAMAGMSKHLGAGQMPEPIPEEPAVPELFVKATIDKEVGSEIKLNTYVHNESLYPPRYENALSYRYFMDLSELYAKGRSVADVQVTSYYNPNKAKISPIKAWDAAKHIYYVEISYDGINIYGKSEFQLVITSYSTNALDASNDPSRKGLTATLAMTEYMPVYRSGVKVAGLEPGELPGQPTPTPTQVSPTPTLPQFKYGDVNGDTLVNSTDYTLVKRFVLGIITEFPSPGDKRAADVNADGYINSTDLTLMKRYLLKIITKFPAEQ